MYSLYPGALKLAFRVSFFQSPGTVERHVSHDVKDAKCHRSLIQLLVHHLIGILLVLPNWAKNMNY